MTKTLNLKSLQSQIEELSKVLQDLKAKQKFAEQYVAMVALLQELPKQSIEQFESKLETLRSIVFETETETTVVAEEVVVKDASPRGEVLPELTSEDVMSSDAKEELPAPPEEVIIDIETFANKEVQEKNNKLLRNIVQVTGHVDLPVKVNFKPLDKVDTFQEQWDAQLETYELLSKEDKKKQRIIAHTLLEWAGLSNLLSKTETVSIHVARKPAKEGYKYDSLFFKNEGVQVDAFDAEGHLLGSNIDNKGRIIKALNLKSLRTLSSAWEYLSNNPSFYKWSKDYQIQNCFLYM